VCADERSPLYRVCKCSTVVHAECFARMILEVRAHQRRCAVCTSEYRVRTQRRLECVVP